MNGTAVLRVAKTQKTFYLNEELSTLVDLLCEGTGASFTKITTAALIRYLFEVGPVHPKWMRLAVLLEQRTLLLPQVFLRSLEQLIEDKEKEFDSMKGRVANLDKPTQDDLLKPFRKFIANYKDALRLGKELFEEVEPEEAVKRLSRHILERRIIQQ